MVKPAIIFLLSFMLFRCNMKIEPMDPSARQSLEDIVSDKSETKSPVNPGQSGLGNSSSISPQGSNGSNWVNGTGSGANGLNSGNGVETTFGGTTGTNSF